MGDGTSPPTAALPDQALENAAADRGATDPLDENKCSPSYFSMIIVVRNNASLRSGFTLLELAVCVTIIAILVGMLLPVINLVKRAATRVACAANQRQVGLAFVAYALDWDGSYPADSILGQRNSARSPAWFDRLPSYADESNLRGPSVFQCPGWKNAPPTVFLHAAPKSLKMNAKLDENGRSHFYREGSVSDAADILLLVDAVAGETGMGQWGHAVPSAVTDIRHAGGVNVLCLDGHTARVINGSEALKWVSSNW